jgi:hypothetical protein
MAGTPIGQIISVDRCDHNMAQAQPGHRFPQPLRFTGVKGPHALVKVDVAVWASPGAAWAHDQERGRAAGKTFTDIGTTGLLANRIQLKIEQQIGNGPNALPLGGFNA